MRNITVDVVKTHGSFWEMLAYIFNCRNMTTCWSEVISLTSNIQPFSLQVSKWIRKAERKSDCGVLNHSEVLREMAQHWSVNYNHSYQSFRAPFCLLQMSAGPAGGICWEIRSLSMLGIDTVI